MANPVLEAARANKYDEFYTYYDDIEKELNNYKEFFFNASIYCPCDTSESNFFKYFINNFKEFNLIQLCASALNLGITTYTGNGTIQYENNPAIYGQGDILSDIVKKRIKQYDVICTNPPFSLLKNFIEILVNLNKKFIIIANENVLINPRVFPYIMSGQCTTGINKIKSFFTDTGEERKFGNIVWLTNLPIKKEYHIFNLTKEYDPDKYPTMENYEAINVDRIKDIPKDYDGVMGVPITYLKNHNPNQFEILGYAGGTTKTSGQNYDVPYYPHPDDRGGNAMVNGVRKFGRVFIKKIVDN